MTATTVVFAGDSITDAGRREDADGLGDGYVRLVAGDPRAASLAVRNAGISGDRAVDLRERWDRDVLALRPDVLTVLIGVNDMWRRYDSGDATSAEAFSDVYDSLLDRAQRAGVGRLILMEPFLVPLTEEQAQWKSEDLDAKIDVVRRLAQAHDADLVPLDAVLREAAGAEPAAVAFDGVHPTPRGHALIAEQWWRGYGGAG